ncbi:MAG TPA: MBL fold metallo-hydrolase [Burkholderiaceae bacterium]|nr:MBL fold metallo-hydrolase [Burkholderiaceae bacterium]
MTGAVLRPALGPALGPAGARSVALAFFAMLVTGALQASEPARHGAPVTVDLRLQQLTERVWWVEGEQGVVSHENQGFNSNAGFVVTDDGVVVFDALGTPALGAALLDRIRSITDKRVRRVIVSHYHSDHFYGVQALKAAGAAVWAHARVRDYLATDAPAERLAERRQSLAPWVTEEARIVEPDVYLDGDTAFRLGGIGFRIHAAGPAHTAEDLMMLVEEDGVLFAGDLIFAGRVPYVGDADSRAWLTALDALAESRPRFVVTGHGPASRDATADIALTHDYLLYLREQMGMAVDDFVPFDEAYDATDWSRFEQLPAFDEANRRNAYNTYLLMENESLAGRR